MIGSVRIERKRWTYLLLRIMKGDEYIMKKRVGVVHTFLYSVEDIKEQFTRQLPEVEIINIIDDSLLKEALENRGITPSIISRISVYFKHCQELGCSCILNQCSSVGEAADIAARLVSIPVLKIDAPMAREAVTLGSRIAVIATAISTVGPSTRLIERSAREIGKQVNVEQYYCDGAYEALLLGKDREKHNRIVIENVERAAAKNDVVVLAQGSMVHLVPLIGDVGKPVLTSLYSGVGQIRDYI